MKQTNITCFGEDHVFQKTNCFKRKLNISLFHKIIIVLNDEMFFFFIKLRARVTFQNLTISLCQI